jgi:phosphate-selective porin OprO/OprP
MKIPPDPSTVCWVAVVILCLCAAQATAQTPQDLHPSSPHLGIPIGDLWIHPIGLLETDARLYPNLQQGTSGFAIQRARLGIAAITDHTYSSITIEMATEHPSILNAYFSYLPWSWLELSVGYRKSPLFITGRDVFAPTHPLMERSAVVRALWPLRDLGAEVIVRPTFAPLDLYLRASNGSAGWIANDDDALALTARLDLSLGQTRDPNASWGLLIGGAVVYENTLDRAGISGETPWGFVFHRVPAVSGDRWVVEGHMQATLGPVSVLVEGGFAQEGRARDTDGNPDTPRLTLDPMTAYGTSAELWWTLFGPRRRPGRWPVPPTDGNPSWSAVEVAARFERLWTGQDSPDVRASGAVGGALSARWWLSSHFALGASGYYYALDQPPVDDPSSTDTWTVMGRFTTHLDQR